MANKRYFKIKNYGSDTTYYYAVDPQYVFKAATDSMGNAYRLPYNTPGLTTFIHPIKRAWVIYAPMVHAIFEEITADQVQGPLIS